MVALQFLVLPVLVRIQVRLQKGRFKASFFRYMLSHDAAAPPRHEVVPNYYYDGNLHMVHHDAADANNSMFWLIGAIVGADAMYRVPTNVGLKLKKQHWTWGGRYNKKN